MSCVRSLIIHNLHRNDAVAFAGKVNSFHAGIIRQRLNQSVLTTEQKIVVIDRIIHHLKLHEMHGIIE